MQLKTVFKKSRIPISYWYLATVVVMSICYLGLARKDFAWMILNGVGNFLVGALLCAVLAVPIGLAVAVVVFIRRRQRRQQN